MNNNQQVFFELLRAGLWEKEARLSQYKDIDFAVIKRLAEEQSVVGLITAGLERVADMKVPKKIVLQFVGSTLQIEQRNQAMNEFVAQLISFLRKNNVYAILVKGQGIAQCYERPLWRVSGDVDLLLNEANYEKAKSLLLPLASDVETEYSHFKHQGMTIKGWEVELHGTQHSRLSRRVDGMLDSVQADVFRRGNVRSWQNGSTQIFLPALDNDVFFVFTHILKHFFIEGIGLRQIGDWCRLLYTSKDSLDYGLLESRIRKAGIMTEWKAFAALAVDWLGMPVEAMPLYSSDKRSEHKAKRIMEFVLEAGNFGHNRKKGITYSNSIFENKMYSFLDHTRIIARHSIVFPLDAIKVWWNIMVSGMKILVDD